MGPKHGNKRRRKRRRKIERINTELISQMHAGQSVWNSEPQWLCKNSAPADRKMKTVIMKNSTLLKQTLLVLNIKLSALWIYYTNLGEIIYLNRFGLLISDAKRTRFGKFLYPLGKF